MLLKRYQTTRTKSEQLCQPLEIEDYGLQAMADTSPIKWHLAHTSWFFETFILKAFIKNYQTFDNSFEYLFNSYYNAIGNQFPRPKRHLISRPTVAQVYQYREHVDNAITSLIEQLDEHPGEHTERAQIEQLIVLGINHEQQHQELMFTDLKFNFFQNPTYPIYQPMPIIENAVPATADAKWLEFNSTQTDIGNQGEQFCFDNETPKHSVYLPSFAIASSLVTNGEYLTFIEDDGYQTSEHWLSDAWILINEQPWQQPLYWLKQDDAWYQFTLHGLIPLDLNAPVTHLSFYEAHAFASWSGCRLPTEFEWEHAVRQTKQSSDVASNAWLEPITNTFYGSVWQWTQSSYQPYPGFNPAKGAVGEYNGKFMCNQLVLKGSSSVTAEDHARVSYRNFFYPHQRWQFSGLRLAKSQ